MNLDGVTPKYRELAERITADLTQNLKKLSQIEDTYAAWTKEQQNEVGITEYFRMFHEAYKVVIDEIGTESLKASRYGGAIGSPSEYWYLFETYECDCVMKSPKKAVIEFRFERGIKKRHQFTMKLVDDAYKLDAVKYGFWGSSGDTTWYKMNI